jgi:hypothetical protein
VAPSHAEGVSEAVRTMRAAEDALDLREITEAAGRVAGVYIRPFVPVRTSALLFSLRPSVDRVGDLVAAGVESDSDHVLPVHYGTVHMAAQPFGDEGLRAAEPALTELYLVGIEKILDSVKGA